MTERLCKPHRLDRFYTLRSLNDLTEDARKSACCRLATLERCTSASNKTINNPATDDAPVASKCECSGKVYDSLDDAAE